MFNCISNWFNNKKKYNQYSFKVQFYVGDLPNSKSDRLCKKFVEFTEKMGFESYGSISYLELNLRLVSNNEIKKSYIRKIKEWLAIHNVKEYTISKVVGYK